MAPSREPLHTFPGRSKRDGKRAHFHTWVAPPHISSLISDSSSSPLIRGRGAAGVSRNQRPGQTFSHLRGIISSRASENVGKEASVSGVNRQRGRIPAPGGHGNDLK